MASPKAVTGVTATAETVSTLLSSYGKAPEASGSYLDAYQRRMRGAKPVYKDDAAGLLGNGRYHGRSRPVKGHGSPPEDKFSQDPKFVPTKKFLPERSSCIESYSNLRLISDDPALDEQPAVRAVSKRTEQSHRSQLMGSAATISPGAAEWKFRAGKRPTTAPLHKTERVLNIGEPDEALPEVPSLWVLDASHTGTITHSRPATAPAHPQIARTRVNTIARQHYVACTTGNADVFQYRHSGGICPQEYKMVVDRCAAPQLSSPAQSAARDAFFESRRSYNFNRVRSVMSQSICVE